MKTFWTFLFIIGILSLTLTCRTVSDPPYVPRNIYVDANNSGEMRGTESQPYQSLSQVPWDDLQGGDRVFLSGGSVFRENLLLQRSYEPALHILPYGIGEPPILLGSVNLLESSWTDQGGNLWSTPLDIDCGQIWAESWSGQKHFDIADLLTRGDFYWDSGINTLYLYSMGDPTEGQSYLEGALTKDIIKLRGAKNVVIQDLVLRWGGAHGIGAMNTQGLRLRGLEIYEIGGGFLHYSDGQPVRYGNGIEFWASNQDAVVEGCYIHDIFDTGLTNQSHVSGSVQADILYQNNILENCGMGSFEFWSHSGEMRRILFHHNTSLNPGQGWGAEGEKAHGHVLQFYHAAASSDISIVNNLFFGGDIGYFFDKQSQGRFSSYEINHNILYPQDGDQYLAILWENDLASSEKWTIAESGSYQTSVASLGWSTESVFSSPNLDTIFPYGPLLGSPALDSARTSTLGKDYLGTTRPGGNLNDLGAIEVP